MVKIYITPRLNQKKREDLKFNNSNYNFLQERSIYNKYLFNIGDTTELKNEIEKLNNLISSETNTQQKGKYITERNKLQRRLIRLQ